MLAPSKGISEDLPLIFIVEDDASLRTELSHLLELSGYRVASCESFLQVAHDVANADPDCVLLDLKLPGEDGHSLCRSIRAQSDVPLIMLTSSDSEFDEVMAMNLGADDYVTKPYSPAILMARIASALRRGKKSQASLRLVHRGVALDVSSCSVAYEGTSTELTRNELKILKLLMQNPGCVISRQEIMLELWASDAFIDDNTLTVNINRLRKTLARIGVPDDFLQTRRGLGYAV